MPTQEQVDAEWNEQYLQSLRDELYEIDLQAQRELIKTAARKYYRNKVLTEAPLPGRLKLAVERYGVDSFIPPKGDKTTKWFVTISAKDDIDPVKFFKQMEKCRVKALLQGSGMYVLEQRSQGDQEPYGWHIHWILRKTEYHCKKTVIQQVYQGFKKFLVAQNYVDLKPEHIKCEEYIRGEKKSDEKKAKVEKDRLLRAKLNIPDIVEY